MERLTIKIGPHVIYNGAHRRYDTGDIPAEMSHDAIRDILRRLAEYEDTGLEPAEITAAKAALQSNIVEAIPQLVEALVERLPQWVAAHMERLAADQTMEGYDHG